MGTEISRKNIFPAWIHLHGVQKLQHHPDCAQGAAAGRRGQGQGHGQGQGQGQGPGQGCLEMTEAAVNTIDYKVENPPALTLSEGRGW
jgi:hypothetical protein